MHTQTCVCVCVCVYSGFYTRGLFWTSAEKRSIHLHSLHFLSSQLLKKKNDPLARAFQAGEDGYLGKWMNSDVSPGSFCCCLGVGSLPDSPITFVLLECREVAL